ncbi:MAG: carbohydrate porin [Phycisphaerales bacterium]
MQTGSLYRLSCILACALATSARSDEPPPQQSPLPGTASDTPAGSPAASSGAASPAPPGEMLPNAGDKPALDNNPDVQGQPPTEYNQEFRLDQTDQKNWLGITPETDPLGPFMRMLSGLKERTGLSFGGAYTMLLQQASGGPGKRTAAGGDIDLMLSWTKKFNETDYIKINSSYEYRFQIGDITPSQLGPEVGTLIPTTNGFNERPPVVKELFYDQMLLDGHLRWIFGRIDPENYVGGHRLQSANTFFLNKAFSSNPTIAYPSIGLGAAAAVKPVDWLYLLAGVSDVNANITRTGFDTAFDTGEVFAWGEIGGMTNIDGLGSGRQRLSYWHSDASSVKNRPSDQGVSLSIDQELGPYAAVFVRTAYADATLTNVRQLYEGGFGFKGLTGVENDYTGIALAYAAPPNGRAETIVEAFHRFQLALRAELTVGAQLILNPGNAPNDNAIGIFECRFRISF